MAGRTNVLSSHPQLFFASLLLFITASCLAACALCCSSTSFRRTALYLAGGLSGLAFWLLLRCISILYKQSAALESLPGPKYGILGVTKAIFSKDPHRWSALYADQYGPIVRLRVLFFNMILVTDPTLAMHVLFSPHFDKCGFLYSFLDPLLNGSSILTGPTDEHWKQVRKGVAPAFSTQHMKEAAQLVVARTEDLVNYMLAEGSEVPQNIDKLLLRESMDVIGEFGFQKQMHALNSLRDPEHKYEKGLSDVDVLLGATLEIEHRLHGPQRAFQLWKPELWHGAYLLRRYRRQVAGLLNHIKDSKLHKDSFADLLLRTKHHKTGKTLSDKQMAPEIAALFFAGIDTTGHTGTWLIYMLTQYPEVEAKVVAELDSLELLVTPQRPHPRKLTYADLSKLEYLQAVVKEVLRVYPPVGIGQMREALTDVSLAGKLNIPRGTIVWVSHFAMQNCAHNWEEPEKFKPERWFVPGAEYAQNLTLGKDWYEAINLSSHATNGRTNPSSENGKRPKRYFPFAEGPRNCVGQSLAKVSLVATAATLLSSLSFKLADQMGGPQGVRAREQYSLVTGIEGGMWLHAYSRLNVAKA